MGHLRQRHRGGRGRGAVTADDPVEVVDGGELLIDAGQELFVGLGRFGDEVDVVLGLSAGEQNTYVPLDIAFMDPSYRVVDIQQMAPLTTEPHESAAPAMFALEVPQGWFAEHGVQVGAVARVVFGLQ